jgi:uncharacterized protein (DUF2132 family)
MMLYFVSAGAGIIPKITRFLDMTMNDEINYQNNPLHGLSLKNLLIEVVDYYGFDILYAYLNINCFKTNPSIESSVKFLKKTDWAREKVEVFYLYEYKNLPRASSQQFALPPRDRIVPEDQTPGEPAKLSLEDAERLREKREAKAAAHRSGSGKGFGDKRTGGYASNSRSSYSDTRDSKPRSQVSNDNIWQSRDESSGSSSEAVESAPVASASVDSAYSEPKSERPKDPPRGSDNIWQSREESSKPSNPPVESAPVASISVDSTSVDTSSNDRPAPNDTSSDPWAKWKK